MATTLRKTSCPHCSEDLTDSGSVVMVGMVPARDDPDGKARVDLILECEHCDGRWNVFVALEDFFANPIAEGA